MAGKKQQPGRAPHATKAQISIRLAQTEQMMAEGWRHSMIVATLRANYGIGLKACEKLITRVYRKWRKGSKKKKSTLRLAQVNRLHSILEKKEITVTERVRVETLLARVQGTEAPMQLAGVDDEPIRMIIEDYRPAGEPKR